MQLNTDFIWLPCCVN